MPPGLRHAGDSSVCAGALGCDYFFDIPSIALKSVLELLANVEFVRLITEGRQIKSVIPRIPPFDDVYRRIGEFAQNEILNEHEEVSLAILNELREKPENKDRLQARLGAEMPTFKRCLAIGVEGGLVSEHRARGRSMLLSPFYFGDSIDELAQLAARAGSDELVL